MYYIIIPAVIIAAAVVFFIVIANRGSLRGIIRISAADDLSSQSEYLMSPKKTRFKGFMPLSEFMCVGQSNYGQIAVSPRKKGTVAAVKTSAGVVKVRAGEPTRIDIPESESVIVTYDLKY